MSEVEKASPPLTPVMQGAWMGCKVTYPHTTALRQL